MINWPINRNSKNNGFCVLATDHGSMIVNLYDRRIDQMADGMQRGIGVSFQLFNKSSFDHEEINFLLQMLVVLRQTRGDGVFMLDGGSNIGVHTISAARQMHGWGEVLAFEAQERIFYSMVGNIVINNLFNATGRWCALGETCGQILIPVPDYLTPSSFGSLELQYTSNSENIGQKIDMGRLQPVQMISIDSLNLPRLDFLKLDVEGMEGQVLRGAMDTILRCKPIIQAEFIKDPNDDLKKIFGALEYKTVYSGGNMLGVPHNDSVLEFLTLE
jgi:FkbM family methyltransferase